MVLTVQRERSLTMATIAEQFDAIGAAALAGAEEALREILDEVVRPTVVVTIAWSYMGRDFVVATKVPEHHGRALLADSLRESASEAEEALR